LQVCCQLFLDQALQQARFRGIKAALDQFVIDAHAKPEANHARKGAPELSE